MDYRFQVNLGGIIDLLSHHLYSGPEVYLRELLQNSVDAIQARKLADPTFASGQVRIEVVADADAPSLVFEDNGIGLTEEQVHRFLATIGESSKRSLDSARTDFIGQFGIGLLSAFMVADEIVLITRHAGDTDKPATEWRGRPDGTYSVRSLEIDLRAGTRVYLRARPDRVEHFRTQTVRDLATKFGGLLPFPITVVAGRQTWSINQQAPWDLAAGLSAAEAREALLDYGREVFQTSFLDCLPLRTKDGSVEGIAFVLPHSPSPVARNKHRIYLKRMLLSEAGGGMLPEWAFFVRCVINADGLRPTASREAFYEDAALEAVREALGAALRGYIVNLARTDPVRLQKFLTVHYLAIKALAVHDDEFCRIFIDHIPFETSLGTMTVRQLRDRNPLIRYTPTVDQFRQVARVAAAQEICVVNAGYTYNEELLQRLPDIFPHLRVEEVSSTSLAQSFTELNLDEHNRAFELLRVATAALRPFKCDVDMRKFVPVELAALYSTDPDAWLFRAAEQNKEISSGPLNDLIDDVLAGDRLQQASKQVLLNYDNPLVQKMMSVSDRELLRQSVQMLYVQALLLGHHPLTGAELSLMNRGLSNLIERSMSTSGNS